MFNKKKDIIEKETVYPWNDENGCVCDYTFATRLFGFLIRNKELYKGLYPIEIEEFEYLLRCAADLKIYQMSVSSSINKTYFNNLRNQTVDDSIKEYLSVIHVKDAYDVNKYLK